MKLFNNGILIIVCSFVLLFAIACSTHTLVRQRIGFNRDRQFDKAVPDKICSCPIYDLISGDDNGCTTLKRWVMPCGTDLIKDSSMRYVRPKENPVSDCPCAQIDFDESEWERIRRVTGKSQGCLWRAVIIFESLYHII